MDIITFILEELPVVTADNQTCRLSPPLLTITGGTYPSVTDFTSSYLHYSCVCLKQESEPVSRY